MSDLQKFRDTLDTIGIPYEAKYQSYDLTGFWVIQLKEVRIAFDDENGTLLGVMEEPKRSYVAERTLQFARAG